MWRKDPVARAGGRSQDPHHCLEAGVQLRQERWLVEQGQHPLLHHGAFHIVVLDDHVLLQDLDGVQLLGPLPVGQHHLPADGGQPEHPGTWHGGGGGVRECVYRPVNFLLKIFFDVAHF